MEWLDNLIQSFDDWGDRESEMTPFQWAGWSLIIQLTYPTLVAGLIWIIASLATLVLSAGIAILIFSSSASWVVLMIRFSWGLWVAKWSFLTVLLLSPIFFLFWVKSAAWDEKETAKVKKGRFAGLLIGGSNFPGLGPIFFGPGDYSFWSWKGLGLFATPVTLRLTKSLFGGIHTLDVTDKENAFKTKDTIPADLLGSFKIRYYDRELALQNEEGFQEDGGAQGLFFNEAKAGLFGFLRKKNFIDFAKIDPTDFESELMVYLSTYYKIPLGEPVQIEGTATEIHGFSYRGIRSEGGKIEKAYEDKEVGRIKALEVAAISELYLKEHFNVTDASELSADQQRSLDRFVLITSNLYKEEKLNHIDFSGLDMSSEFSSAFEKVFPLIEKMIEKMSK